MTAVTEGTIQANGVTFAYRAAGDEAAPLALLLHGFPDSAHTWRHLLPLLAGAGYGAVQHAEAPWRRLVTMALPPMAALAQGFLSYDQLRRSWYMFFFQHPLAEVAVPADDLAFIERLWADWSPGYDAAEDLPAVKDALEAPENPAAALGYYRAAIGATGLSDDPEVVALQAAADGGSPPIPTLYLHGADDGCIGADLAAAVAEFLPTEGSHAEVVPGAGHFLHVERPDEVGRLVLDFVGEPQR